MEIELQKGKDHVNFCLRIYAMQLAAKRHFVHEHPEGPTAWSTPEMVEIS